MQHPATPATASSDSDATALHSEALVSADDLRRYTAALKAAEREKQKSHGSAEEAARKEYIAALRTPVEITETHVHRAMARFREAARRGEARVLVYRFPVELCTDDGRAINNAEEGWEATLTGVPLSIYEAWRTHLRDKGFHLSAEIIEFYGRDRISRDAGLFISWQEQDTPVMNGFGKQSDNRVEQFIAMAALALLAIGCLVILSPFVSALLWAVILCFSTWPLYRRAERLFGGRRTLAAAVLTLLVALVLLGPLVLVGARLADSVGAVAGAVRVLLEEGPPDPPPWLAGLPLVGGRVAAYWQSLAHDGAALAAALRGHVSPAAQWVLNAGLRLGEGILYLSLSLLIGFFLYRDGAAAASRLEATLGRIAGDRARRLLEVAGGTMKGVVYGILGACLVQGLLAAFGFWLAGVPGALLLGALTAVLALVPVGPALVWLPASLWLFKTGAVGWGIFIILWGLFVVGTIDNVIKPYFISRGGGLPFVLVLLGVLGGVVAFGFLGLFVGPTLLAVGYSLLREWTVIERQERTERPARRAGAEPAAEETASAAAPTRR